MRYSIDEFAQEIRNLFPGDYDDLSNDELVRLWLKKYPADKEKIDFSIIKKKHKESKVKEVDYNSLPNTNNGGYKILKRLIVTSVILIIISVGFLYVIDKVNISSINSDSEFSNYFESNPFDEIIVDQEISDQVDNSSLIESLGFSGDEIIKIKKILSDPNPDPENKSGDFCGDTRHKCKWCGSEYYVSSYYEPIQKYINFAMVFDGLSAVTANLQKLFGGNPAGEFRDLINSYEKGNKYTCKSESDNGGFCSPKCKEEEKYSRY